MRDYSQVRPRFWIAGSGKSLRGDAVAQVVAVYLFTSPHANMSGLYYLPLPTLAHETGIPIKGALKALRRVCEAGIAQYDDENEVVWVCAMLKEQVGDSLKPGDKRCKGIANIVEPLRNTPLFDAFVYRYGDAFHLPFTRPTEAPSKPLRSQEQEQEQEQERNTSASPTREVFEHWVSIHVPESHRSQTRLNAKRSKLIKARFGEGYTADTLKAAITGVQYSPFHMGDNDKGQRYTGLQTILRDGEQVEKFANLAASPPVDFDAERKRRAAEAERRHREAKAKAEAEHAERVRQRGLS